MKKIFLTFDDGPSSTTELLLDVLKKHRVKASFFVTNREQRADLLKRIADEGHTIALHSYSHDYETVYSSKEGYFDDLQKIDDLVYQTVGIRSKIVRLPGGSHNTVHERFCEGIMPQIISELMKRGYRVIDWDCDNNDGVLWHLPPEAYFAYFLDQISGREETVFLSHTRARDEESVRSVDLILDYCEKNGWVTDTVENYNGAKLIGSKLYLEQLKQKSAGKCGKRPGPYLTLVNKQNLMSREKAAGLVITDFEDIAQKPVKIEMHTLFAFLKMKCFLMDRGITVGIESAFRSVGDQKLLWDVGMQKPDFDYDEFEKWVALPWGSEHHTGLAIDLLLKQGDEWVKYRPDKEQKEVYSVIHRVCPRFGFILRYPQGKEAITGYHYEPWHLRYVGIRHARAMYRQKLTLEEYTALLP